MRTKEEGIPSETTIIINQGASNYTLERPTTNIFVYYIYITRADTNLWYLLVKIDISLSIEFIYQYEDNM